MSKDLSKIVFASILILALYLRLHGITNGLPYIFHVDEPSIIRSALGIRFFPNPGHFDWPHLYVYFSYFIYMGFAKIRDILGQLDLKTVAESVFPLMWNDELVYYFITRVTTALFGAFTVVPVYLTAKNLFGTKAGLLAALAFTLIPFHIRHTHYALPDGVMVFFVAWALYYASKILVKDDANHYAGAGAYLGLAASTKYNGGLTAFMIPFAHVIRVIKNKESFLTMNGFMNLTISVLIAIIAFIVGTPYAVLDYTTFVRKDGPQGALWQFKNVGSVELSERLPHFFTELTTRLADDLAYVFLIVFFMTLVLLIAKAISRKTTTVDIYAWFVVSYGIVLLFYLSGFDRPRSHYYMITYPFIAVIFGYFVSYLHQKLEPKIKWGMIIVYACLFVGPLYFSAKQTFIFSNPDTRNLLADWLTANVDKSQPIIYASDDFAAVMATYEKQSYKGLEKIGSSNTGFVLIGDLAAQNSQSFSILKYGDKLERVYFIPNEYNNGPEITIYRITK